MVIPIAPRTLTIIATYRCNAACSQCCFACNPATSEQLTSAQLLSALSIAKSEFPSLRVAVFTGGEATLLKKDLLSAISAAGALGLTTRLVSNGHWGKSEAMARRFASDFRLAGLNEVNLSTGLEHQQWVPPQSIINAAKASAANGIPCIITIEADIADQRHYLAIANDGSIRELLASGWLALQTNTWIPFGETPFKRVQHSSKALLRRGCDQPLDNLTVTPHGEVVACCGLTMGQIESMTLGRIENLGNAYRSQADDFMKHWLRMDGPYTIIERIMGQASHRMLEKIIHPCEACLLIYSRPEIMQRLHDNYIHFVDEVMTRFAIDQAMSLLQPSEPCK